MPQGEETDKGLLVTLPSGERVYYVDETHAYYLCKPDEGRGKRLTSVSTVAKVFDVDASRLLSWAARTQCIGIAHAWEKGGSTDWLGSAEDIWKHLESLSLTFEDVRQEASRVGTHVHEHAFEALGRGEQVPDREKLTDVEWGHSQGIMKFWLDHEPTTEQVEQIVFSPKLGCAGRLDFRGELSPCGDEACACKQVVVELPGAGIVDCKTGKYVFASDHVQVAGYRKLSVDSGYGKTDWALILHTREDGTYELIKGEATVKHFESAVRCYRNVGEVSRLARKAWKARHG
jgi:hypothetical protein